MQGKQIRFGDYVQVIESPLTKRLGIAGLTGRVYGEATPSITCIAIIGELQDDYAVNVYFDELSKTKWISPGCLRLIISAKGFEVSDTAFGKKTDHVKKV